MCEQHPNKSGLWSGRVLPVRGMFQLAGKEKKKNTKRKIWH